jgi:hypothetical protein
MQMHDRNGGVRTACALLLAALMSLAVAACGSSSGAGQANSLLKQTFSGTHPVNSGNLSFNLTVTPTGSNTLKTPISLSFGGPFQSLGSGKLPKSDFNVSLTGEGTGGTLGIVSTGTTGYITLQGTSYQLPAATFHKLESSFAGLGSNPSGGSGSLSKLGIQPLHWLSNPSVVGTESVDGTSTTHIRATINVAALLADLNTFLERASSVGVSGANKISSTLSATTRNKIAEEVRNPTFDVWTGSSDKTVRRLVIQLTLPVSGQVSTLLGGLSSAGIALTMRYADLNQPQTISAPTAVRPFNQFESKLRSFLSGLEQSLGAGTGAGALGSSTGAAGSPGTTTGSSNASSSASGTSNSVQRYSQCIINAHNDVAKMQQCASLINGK